MSDDHVWTPGQIEEDRAESPDMALMPPHPFDLDKLKSALQPHIVSLKAMVEKAKDFSITSAETNTTAIEMASQMAKLKKDLESGRKGVIKDYSDVVNGINTAVKPIKDLTDKAVKALKNKIGAYNAEQAELARRIAQKKAEEDAEEWRKVLEAERKKDLERQERERKEAQERKERLDAEAKAAGVEAVEVKIPEVVDPGVPEIMITVPKAVTSGIVRTAEGTSFTVKSWKFKVITLDHIPDQYTLKAVDSKAVQAAIDSGVSEIPGLEIYEHSDVRLRTK